MSISTVLTLGYGQFGDIPSVVLLGYGLEGEVPPPPTPPDAPAVRLGGGPFWRKRRYYDEDEEERREETEIAEVIAEISPEATDAVKRAVQAIGGAANPMPVVLKAEEIYARVVGRLQREIRAELQIDRIERAKLKRIWEAEVRRKLQEQEDEEIMTLALSID